MRYYVGIYEKECMEARKREMEKGIENIDFRLLMCAYTGDVCGHARMCVYSNTYVYM